MIMAEFTEKLAWIDSLSLTIEKKINPAAPPPNPYEVHKEHEKRVNESKRCWVLLQVGEMLQHPTSRYKQIQTQSIYTTTYHLNQL